MFNKHNRSSLNAIKTENESEEKLLEKIARIQALLKEVDDNTSDSDNVIEIGSSNEENKEPRKYSDRVRYNSPLSSVRPVTPPNDDSNDYKDDYDRVSKFDSKPFYSLPSTSKGYSPAYNDVFSIEEPQNESPKHEKKPKIENEADDENDWVPLTFLDKNPKKPIRHRSPTMTYRPPRIVDLSYKTQMERNMRERYQRHEYKSSSSISESEKYYKRKRRYYFPEIAEKRKKKRRLKEERRRKEAEESIKKLIEMEESEKAIVVNPLSLIKRENDNDDDSNSTDDNDNDKYNDYDPEDYDRKPDYYDHHNYDHDDKRRVFEKDVYNFAHNSTEIERKRKFEESNSLQVKRQRLSDDEDYYDYQSSKEKWTDKQKEQDENSSEDVKPNVNMLKNLGKNFNACVSIASKIPDEALNFLNLIPFDKIKTENTKSPIVNESTATPSPSSSSIVNNIIKQEKPEENEKIVFKSHASTKSRKVDFSSELKRFSQKLQKIKSEEENL